MSIWDVFNRAKIAIGRPTPFTRLYLPDYARPLHLRIAGEPSTGKTRLGAYVAYMDAKRNLPVVIVDGNGGLIEDFIRLVLNDLDHDRILNRFVYAPFDRERVHGFPFFDYSTDSDPFSAADILIEAILRMYPDLEMVGTTLKHI